MESKKDLSPQVPPRATQVPTEQLTPERKAAIATPLHASQASPDFLSRQKFQMDQQDSPNDDEESSTPPAEGSFIFFEKTFLARHVGGLENCMIYSKKEEDSSTSHEG